MARLQISLANKCQLMFGAAVVLIITAALAVPWLRMADLVSDGQRVIARGLAESWLADLLPYSDLYSTQLPMGVEADRSVRDVRLISRDDLEIIRRTDPVLDQAMRMIDASPDTRDVLLRRRDSGERLYLYVRAVRQSDIDRARGSFDPSLGALLPADPLRGVMTIEMRAHWADSQMLLNRICIIGAGILAGLLAIAVFWYISTRVILSPVRVLRDTADKVAAGDLNIRADIATGDEYEQLSDAFNTMLVNMKKSQDKLTELNKQLDLKLGELARTNVTLFEANKLKTDFLANVSHELRTPLNSIIGFADVLRETMGESHADPEKQRRYVEHITNSSQALLDLITDLLDLAKIEAGRIDVHVEAMSVSDVCESLANLIRPQADAKGLDIELAQDENLPVIQTDPGKFQQILFNFLANAVKFTPLGGRITLGASVERRDGKPVGVRVWVADTGPGIPLEEHEAIFEKFRQIDASHTKHHGGTGLGLAISRELARLLQGRIELDSDSGRGATFTLIVPLELGDISEPLMPNLND